MNIEEVINEASKKADEYYKKIPPNHFQDMMQDLRAIGKSDDEIWKEFITLAFLHGYCEAKKEAV